MNINKIDNGYTVEYQVERPDTGSSWDSAYVSHTFAFITWSDLVDWISKNEGIAK